MNSIYLIASYLLVLIIIPIMMDAHNKDVDERLFQEYYEIAMAENEAYHGLSSPLYMLDIIEEFCSGEYNEEIAKRAVEKAINDHLNKSYGESNLDINLKIKWETNDSNKSQD